jgi:dihydropteroate synthase
VKVGIVNITPDSFSDGGLFLEADRALAQSKKLLKDGAGLVEFGAQSTRPGSSPVGAQEEIRRLKPVLERCSEIKFGVDTYRGEVAKWVLDFNPVYINDISGGRDPLLLESVAESGCEIILMHSRLVEPHVFGEDPKGDIVDVVCVSLERIVERALSFGIKKEKIVLDTGAGAFLSSKPEDSFELLRRYHEVQERFDFPFMIAVSRKGFLKQGNESFAVLDRRSHEIVKGINAKYYRVHEVSDVLVG